MQSDFLIETQTTGRTLTLALFGELDMISGPALEQALEQVREPDADLIIVDLRGLDFMDSTGLHLLVQAQQQAQDSGRRFALIRGVDQVRRLLELSGVAESIAIFDSPDELLEVDPAPRAP